MQMPSCRWMTAAATAYWHRSRYALDICIYETH